MYRFLAAMVALAGSAALPHGAQSPPRIEHDALECVARSDFAELSALVVPPDEIRNCRVYFRSNAFPDFYYVEMARRGELFTAYFPKPNELTARVEYYLECLDLAFASSRTLALEAPVVGTAGECRRRNPAAAFFTGDDPAILIGAVRPGAPALPSGFFVDGLISAAGGSGGGTGAGTIAAIGAGATAAAVAGVAVLNDPEPDAPQNLPPEVVAPPPPGGGGGPPPPGPATSVRACFEMMPASGVILEGEQLTLDGRCSTGDDLTFDWQLGDGRTRTGPFVRPTYDVPGSYDVRLAVQSGTDSTQRDALTKSIDVRRRLADVSIVKTAQTVCDGFDVLFAFTLTVDNKGPRAAENVVVTDLLPSGLEVKDADPECVTTGRPVTCALGALASGESATIELVAASVADDDSADDDGRSFTNVARVTTDTEDPIVSNNESAVVVTSTRFCGVIDSKSIRPPELGWTSRLELSAEAGAGGRITVNDRHTVIAASAPSRHRVDGLRGRNTIEAQLTEGASEEGRWTFDFSGADAFVPGRIRVESGDVLASTPLSVTFRVRAGRPERLRFSVVLKR